MKIKDNDKGITLIELIIVMALITVVLGVIYNIFFVSKKTFEAGVNKAAIQQEARVVANEITDRLKFATSVYTTKPTSGEYYKIFIENKSLVIDKYNGEATPERQATFGSNISRLKFYTKGSTKVINFKLYIATGSEPPTIESSILLSNSTISNIPIEIGEEVPELYYKADYYLVEEPPNPPEEPPNPPEEPPNPPEDAPESPITEVVPGTTIEIQSDVWPTAEDYIGLESWNTVEVKAGEVFQYDGNCYVIKQDKGLTKEEALNGPPTGISWYVTPLSQNIVSFDNNADPDVYHGFICKYEGLYYVYTEAGGNWVTHPPGGSWFRLPN